ncbi:MAG: sarcosine oxidase subunit gamma, partial [Hasllibacter sp.]
MADLAERDAGRSRYPIAVGGARAAELAVATGHPGFAAAGAQVGARLGMPAPGRGAAARAGRVLWFGHGQAMLIGAPPLGAVRAADQSDAWCRVLVSGPRAGAALARLVPIDLRASEFGEGAVARTLLGHMSAL